MSRLQKIIAILMLCVLLGGGGVAAGDAFDQYKMAFGEPRWQIKLNSFVDAVYNQLSSLNSLITNWVTVENIPVKISGTLTFISGTQFTVTGDRTSYLPANATLIIDLGSDGVKFNSVASSSYGGGVTTVNLNTSNLTSNLANVMAIASRNGLWPWGDGRIFGRDYGAPGQAALNAAIAAIGSLERTLTLYPGTWTISTDTTIPANITLEPERGAVLTRATGSNHLYINNSFRCGPHQCFNDNSTNHDWVVFASNSPVKGVPQWWGAAGDGTTNDNAAVIAAITANIPIHFPKGTYLCTAGATFASGITTNITGEGNASIVKTDVGWNFTNAVKPQIKNLRFENVTTPYLIDPFNTGNGYQPTVNDPEYAGLTDPQKNQNIGPTIQFTASSNGRIGHITGEFVCIHFFGGNYNRVTNCDFRAGKGTGAGILFWLNGDVDNVGNEAVNNTVREASYSGIAFVRNVGGTATGNIISYCGESGVKTWSGVLGGFNARCSKMNITNNQVYKVRFDGLDMSCDIPNVGTYDASSVVANNIIWSAIRTGIYADGKNFTIANNNFIDCGVTGMALAYVNYSRILGNLALNNNSTDTVGENNSIIGGNNIVANNTCIRTDAGVVHGWNMYVAGNDNQLSNNRCTDAVQAGEQLYIPNTTTGNFSVANKRVTGDTNLSIGEAPFGGVSEGVSLGVSTAAPAAYSLRAGTIKFYLDEAGSNLKVAVTYYDGTQKVGTIALTAP